MTAEAFLVARLALSQGPEETPVPSLRACTSRARTMAAGPTECDGGSRKGGFRDINMQLRRVGAPTAPVRDRVEPGAGSTSNAPLRRSSTWCSPPTSPMVGGWTDCPQWRVCVGERGGGVTLGNEEPPDGDSALHVSPSSHKLRSTCSRCLHLPLVRVISCAPDSTTRAVSRRENRVSPRKPIAPPHMQDAALRATCASDRSPFLVFSTLSSTSQFRRFPDARTRVGSARS